jgi:hypothetical protein
MVECYWSALVDGIAVRSNNYPSGDGWLLIPLYYWLLLLVWGEGDCMKDVEYRNVKG